MRLSKNKEKPAGSQYWCQAPEEKQIEIRTCCQKPSHNEQAVQFANVGLVSEASGSGNSSVDHSFQAPLTLPDASGHSDIIMADVSPLENRGENTVDSQATDVLGSCLLPQSHFSLNASIVKTSKYETCHLRPFQHSLDEGNSADSGSSSD